MNAWVCAAGLLLALVPCGIIAPAYKQPLRTAVRSIRQLHSGHVGDYAAFFTFGVAAIGIALGLLIRY